MPQRIPLVLAREAVATIRTGLAPLLGRLTPLPAASGDGDRLPVVLVHGFMGHPEQFRPLLRKLLKAGYPHIGRVAYPSTTASFEYIVGQIDEAVRAAAGSGQVYLIGHSLGAVACRAYTKLYGGHHLVRRFVAIGGPHAGTSLYRFTPPNIRGVLNPRGAWVERLSVGPEKVPTIVIRARYDHQVFPPRRAQLPGIREIVLGGHGHNGLLWAREAHNAVLRGLRGSA